MALQVPARRLLLLPIFRANAPLRYGTALIMMVAAALLQRALWPWIAPAPFLFLPLAVVTSAWVCGTGPALLAAFVGAASALSFFLPHAGLDGASGARSWVAITGFGLVSLTVIFVTAVARRVLTHELAERLRSDALAVDLSRSQQDFRALAEGLPQVIWIARAEGGFEFCNRHWLETYGQAPDDSSRDGWKTVVHRDDLPLVMEKWRKSAAEGVPYEIECRFRCASGYRWFLIRGVPVRDGDRLRWFGSNVDIHDQRTIADKAHFLAGAATLLSSSLDHVKTLKSISALAVPLFADWAAVDLLDANGTLQRVSVDHVDPKKVALGQEIFRRAPPRPDDPSGAAAVIRTGKAELTREITPQMVRDGVKDPELLALYLSLDLRSAMVVPIVARGRTLGAITFVWAESGRLYEDSDFVLAQELGRRAGVAIDNARLYREAQEASRLKDEFLSTLSHELRTPLTAVVGWARILSADVTDPDKLRRGLQSIDRNANAQAQLIDDMLDVSRIVTGKLRLDVRSFDPSDSIRAAIDTVSLSAEAKGVRLQSVLDPRAGPVQGDPDRLQQIAWNLLSNAVKFTPRGGRVQVHLSRVDSHIELEVSDTGQGIEPAFLQHVFERFRQGDASVSRTQGGLGLGLAIVRHLVEIHGGSVSARSDGAGKGSSFLVKLPLSVSQSRSEPAPELPHPAAHASAPLVAARALEGLRVLVVDDSVDSREVLTQALSDQGASVTAAEGAVSALTLLGERPFDVLISDIGMPGMDGFSLIEAVRRQPGSANGNIRAAALTAYARGEDRTRALKAGFDLHLPKPVDPSELAVAVSALARRR